LTILDTSNLTSLKTLICKNNQLTTLQTASLLQLQELDCENNLLTSLDTTNLILLTNLICSYNSLTTLNVDTCSALTRVDCSYNQIQFLDFNDLPNLGIILVNNNNLTTLYIKNGNRQTAGATTVHSNPDLSNVCLDAIEQDLGSYITTLYPDCVLGFDCDIDSTGDDSKLGLQFIPNPVADFLNISFGTNKPMTSLNIYNMLGQLVYTTNQSVQVVDVSSLKPGSYITAIVADGKTQLGKFIKK
jgi:hypothetical protein